MHVCFIIQNGLTMMQKTSNNDMSFFDHIKYSLETLIKNLQQNNYLRQEDIIHLFVTSSTEPISSYEHNDLHLFYQIKNIQCTIPTFPAEVIESALYHIGKFRCLNQSQTLMGYRQGTIFQPAIIFYITDRSNQRHLNKIYKFLLQKRFQLRSQYSFVTIKFCSSDPNNVNVLEKIKSQIQSSRQSIMTQEIMKKMNGKLFFSYKSNTLINIVKSYIENYRPSLAMKIQSKEYKIHNKQISKIQLSIQNEVNYLKKIKQIGISKKNNIYFPSDNSLFVSTIPIKRSFQIPLPLQLQSININTFDSQNNILIDKFQNLSFSVDFTKQFNGEIQPIMKYFFNTYQIIECQELEPISNYFKSKLTQKRFPLSQNKGKTGQQLLIGFLRLSFQIQHTLKKPCWELHISFSNFINLNSNIRAFRQRQPNFQQYFQNYVSTLPVFYHRFLKLYLQHMNIQLNDQIFQNINSKPVGITNLRFYDNRLNQKKKLANLFKINKQKHENNESDCCAIYSKKFAEFQKQRSNFYLSIKNKFDQGSQIEKINDYLQKSLLKLSDIKKIIGISDYFTIPRIDSTPMKNEYQKYNIRRDDDQLNQIVGDLLGNPFKKLNKKVKIDDEAQSIWVDQEEFKQMKELLDIQKQIVSKIKKNNSTDKDQLQMKNHSEKTNNLYDQLVNMKEKLKKQIKKSPQIISQFNQMQNNKIQIQTINSSNQEQDHKQSQSFQQKKQYDNTNYNENKDQLKLIQNTFQQKFQLSINQQNQYQQKSSQYSLNQPAIIFQINRKFKINKKLLLQIPSTLLSIENYEKNKNIFKQIIPQ